MYNLTRQLISKLEYRDKAPHNALMSGLCRSARKREYDIRSASNGETDGGCEKDVLLVLGIMRTESVETEGTSNDPKAEMKAILLAPFLTIC